MDQGKITVPPIGLTAKYPDIGTGPCSVDIYRDPAIYEKEIEAIFKRSWYMIGRVEQVAKAGDFFVYELPTFRKSVLVCRDRQGEVHAFHNVCPHRGNVVEHRTSGRCNGLFMCRFHGWSFDLKGNLAGLRDEEGFFDVDRSRLGLKPIPMEIWQGFIFVSPVDEPPVTLEQYLGQQGKDLEGYDFSTGSQVSLFETEVACNWKLVVDSFAEVYHIPVLHRNSVAPALMGKANPFGRLLDVQLKGPHRTNSHWAAPPEVVRPVTQLAFRAAEAPMSMIEDRVRDDASLPVGLNAMRSPNWVVDLCIFFPSLMFVASAGMYYTHQVWPISANRCIYQQRFGVRSARTAAERFAQENSLVEFRDIVMEDLSTLERIQRSLDTGVINEFHFHDHELALRHQHKVVNDIIAAYDREQEAADAA